MTFGGHQRGGLRPHFHCWWLTACHPSSIRITDWRLRGEPPPPKKKWVQDGSFERTKLPPKKGATEMLINDKECTFFVCRWRLFLVRNLLWIVQNGAKPNTTWEVMELNFYLFFFFCSPFISLFSKESSMCSVMLVIPFVVRFVWLFSLNESTTRAVKLCSGGKQRLN